jgi:hypothetical protein
MGSSKMVRDASGYYEQKVHNIITEGLEMERNVRNDLVVHRDNSGGTGTSATAQHREPNNAGVTDQSRADITPVLYQARASYTFESSYKDELHFRKGQIINVTNDLLGGWGTGYLDGVEPKRKGLFPLNYVEYFSCNPILPSVNIQELVQNQAWTIASSASPVYSDCNPYGAYDKSQSDHYLSPSESTTRQQPPDSITTDINLRPIEQPRSQSADIVSNRDSRNTLATVPEEWVTVGNLDHAMSYSVTTQRHKGNGEFVCYMVTSSVTIMLNVALGCREVVCTRSSCQERPQSQSHA